MTHRNDTFGELTGAEHAALRENARPCSDCGMLATVDPVLHESRYGHAPAYREAGVERRWNGVSWDVQPEPEAGS